MAAIGPDVYTDRLRRARDAAGVAGVDVLLVSPGPDLRYLVGYAAPPLERLTCLVLPARGEPTLVVPRLEQPAALASGACEIVAVAVHEETDDAYRLALGVARDALGGAPACTGVSDRMWAAQVLRFRAAAPDAEQCTAGGVLQQLRVRKSAGEVAALRRAAGAIDAVHARIGEWLRPGRTEREVARDIADAIIEVGHETVNFVIVASGPNGASPHHHASERVIEPGDAVVIDIGGTMPDGYCSDCTRTYVAGGRPDPEFARYYEVLRDAQQRACDAVQPGVTAEAVDAVARDAITAAGYGEFFVHRTGHGIGLEEHEQPWIVSGDATPLQRGMCFSVEPGIYLSGRHGARIEDIVAVTDTGVERLDTIERELVVVG